MKHFKMTVAFSLAVLIGLVGIGVMTFGGSDAAARVGRPVTPVSVAGAGRRTVRRCAAGVYNC